MQDATDNVESMGIFAKATMMYAKAPVQYSLKAVKSGGRVLHIFDNVSKKSALRLDLPHVGYQYHHWNVNWMLSGAKDPHAAASAVAVRVGSAVNEGALLLEKAAPVLSATAFAVDAARLGCAAYDDFKSESCVPEKTLRTVANVS
ncbi:Protein C13G5.2 [Aphelenchoides avenae]|nr:Protein C13G5.2 [Aphelenchus avenae]